MSTLTKELTKPAVSARLNAVKAKDLAEVDLNRKASEVEFAVWIRALLQNWRQGTVGCKGRSDVARSNKKPWKQKGTGRARAGSARSPLWRGGGVIFGPQERTRTLTLNSKQKNRVLTGLVAQAIERERLLVADWSLDSASPKTSLAYAFLKDALLATKKVTLLLSPMDSLTYASFANIPNVRLVFFDQVNAFDLADGQYLLVLKKDLDIFKTMVAQWN